MRRKVIWVAVLLAVASGVAYANYPAPIFSATVIPAGSPPK